MNNFNPDLLLANRSGLPEPLRVLLADYPRIGWEAHPNFSGLVQFWLERHLNFRKLCEVLTTDTMAVLERDLELQQYAGRMSRFGGMLLNQLHGHHQIEDHHYFPTLSKLDGRIEAGFDILEKDHEAMDGLLNRFATAANGVLNIVADEHKARDAAGEFLKEVKSFERMLDRHLNDEEELIVPVILKTGGGGLS